MRPSDVYVNCTKESMQRLLKEMGLRVVAFRQPKAGENWVLAYSSNMRVCINTAQSPPELEPVERLIVERV
jgi:hypothetical protein